MVVDAFKRQARGGKISNKLKGGRERARERREKLDASCPNRWLETLILLYIAFALLLFSLDDFGQCSLSLLFFSLLLAAVIVE